jgi:hypothetical protein
MEGYKLEVHVAKAKKREDAFWYRGDSIASIQFPNGKKLFVDTCGEIRIQFEEDGTFYRNDQAVDMALNLDLVDTDLNKIGIDFDGWDNNNWFAIREYDIDGDCSSDDLGICHDYDDAINLLKEVAKEKQKEYYKNYN